MIGYEINSSKSDRQVIFPVHMRLGDLRKT